MAKKTLKTKAVAKTAGKQEASQAAVAVEERPVDIGEDIDLDEVLGDCEDENVPKTQMPVRKSRKYGFIRAVVRGAYDVQKIRIQVGNRIVANFKVKMGIPPSTNEKQASKEAKLVLDKIRESYRKLTDGVKTFPRSEDFKGDEVISTYTEIALVAQYFELDKSEKQHFRRLENMLTGIPIYDQFLEGIVGVGPAMAGVLISEIDIEVPKYASSIWQYAGLGVEKDGKGTSKRTEHLHDIPFVNKGGKWEVRKGIRFNPFLKTKLMGVLAGSFLRKGNEKYVKIFKDYKHRLQHRPDWEGKKKGHVNFAALRYMIKRFLVDLYVAWKTLEGLPVMPEYSEAKLGLYHGNRTPAPLAIPEGAAVAEAKAKKK